MGLICFFNCTLKWGIFSKPSKPKQQLPASPPRSAFSAFVFSPFRRNLSGKSFPSADPIASINRALISPKMKFNVAIRLYEIPPFGRRRCFLGACGCVTVSGRLPRSRFFSSQQDWEYMEEKQDLHTGSCDARIGYRSSMIYIWGTFPDVRCDYLAGGSVFGCCMVCF